MENSKYTKEDVIIKKALKYTMLDRFVDRKKNDRFIERLLSLQKYDVNKRAKIFCTFCKNFLINGDDILKQSKIDAYELHYEDFMQNGIRDEANYSNILASCLEDKRYFYAVKIIDGFKKLEEQGFDSKTLSKQSFDFYNLTKKLEKDCKFDQDFDYSSFYYFNDIRNDISHKIGFYLKDVEKIAEEFVDDNEQTLNK